MIWDNSYSGRDIISVDKAYLADYEPAPKDIEQYADKS